MSVYDVRENLWMNIAVKWCHWNIYELMHKFIHYYKNIGLSLSKTFNPFLLIFILKTDMQEKETITFGRKPKIENSLQIWFLNKPKLSEITSIFVWSLWTLKWSHDTEGLFYIHMKWIKRNIMKNDL